jgi:hypothetical protein
VRDGARHLERLATTLGLFNSQPDDVLNPFAIGNDLLR